MRCGFRAGKETLQEMDEGVTRVSEIDCCRPGKYSVIGSGKSVPISGYEIAYRKGYSNRSGAYSIK